MYNKSAHIRLLLDKGLTTWQICKQLHCSPGLVSSAKLSGGSRDVSKLPPHLEKSLIGEEKAKQWLVMQGFVVEKGPVHEPFDFKASKNGQVFHINVKQGCFWPKAEQIRRLLTYENPIILWLTNEGDMFWMELKQFPQSAKT